MAGRTALGKPIARCLRLAYFCKRTIRGKIMRISLSAAWDEAKAILARDGRLLGAVALAMLVLPGIIFDLSMPVAKPGEIPPVGAWVGIGAVTIAISLAGQLALIRLALGTGSSVGDAIAHGFRRLLPYVGALLLWILPLMLIAAALYGAAGVGGETPRRAPAFGFLLVILAGLFIAFRLLLSSTVASAENLGPVGILKRSWALGRGNWWRLFAFALLFVITLIVLLGAVSAVLGSAIAAATGALKPWSLGTLLLALVTQLISSAVSVVFFVMLARMYRQVAGASGSKRAAAKARD